MIISKENEKIKKLIQLKTNQKSDNLFLVEGQNFYELAKKNNVFAYAISHLEELLNENDLFVSEQIMKLLSTTNSIPKIITVCLKKTKNFNEDNYLLLDNIQDPGNLGTIIRSSLAFGVKNIILSNNCVNIYNQKVLRATQGAIFDIAFEYKDLQGVVFELKNKGYEIYGTALENGSALDFIPSKFALIVGNEGQGISKDILEITDQNIFIPIINIESLNVSIATSIILYEWRKR